MPGAEFVEWYQTRGLQLCHAIPFTPFRPLRAVVPTAASVVINPGDDFHSGLFQITQTRIISQAPLYYVLTPVLYNNSACISVSKLLVILKHFSDEHVNYAKRRTMSSAVNNNNISTHYCYCYCLNSLFFDAHLNGKKTHLIKTYEVSCTRHFFFIDKIINISFLNMRILSFSPVKGGYGGGEDTLQFAY